MGFLLKVLFFCGVVFASTGEEFSLSPSCKNIGPCSGVFGAGESTAKDIYALCESVMNQDICRDVPEKYRFQCGRPDPHTHHLTPSFPGKSSFPEASLEATPTNDALGFFKSCGVGLYEGGADILSFLWSVMKYALHPPAALRGMARGVESEAAQSARLYLAGEYEKALSEATGPAKSVKAIGSVSGGVFGKLFDAIYGFLYREVEEFKCMNLAGRMNTICYLAVDFLIPPAAAIAFLKQGKVPGKMRESLKNFSPFPPKVLSRVKVPRALETEAGLRSRGFRDVYIAGMDEMHRMEAIADALRRNRVDPNVTHIEDFADQVEDHIAFFKRSGKAEEAMEELSREARKMVQDKKVTYNWWMQWNLKMVDAVDDITGSPVKMKEMLSMRKGDFRSAPFGLDEVIYLPTTKELGVMAFNQSSSKKLRPLGLLDRTDAHEPLNPLEYFAHDIEHGEAITLFGGVADHKSYKVFHQSFREKVKDLPKDRREKVETLLFILTHEYPGFVRSVPAFTDSTVNFDKLESILYTRQHLLPSSVKEIRSRSPVDYKNAVVHYYKSASKEFETIAREIQKGR